MSDRRSSPCRCLTAKLKEELSALVSLDLWQASASLSRSKHREMMRKASELEGMLTMRGEDVAKAESQSHEAKEEVDRRKLALESERAVVQQRDEMKSIADQLDTTDIERDMESVQSQLCECDRELNDLEDDLSKCVDSSTQEIQMLRSKLNEKVAAENKAKERQVKRRRELDMAMMELDAAKRQTTHLQSEWEATFYVEDDSLRSHSPTTCPTCGQSIVSSEA